MQSDKRKILKTSKEEMKKSNSLFSDDMILYIENTKDSTRTLLETISKYSKVSGCKINVQKSIVFLYSNNCLLYTSDAADE